MCGRFHFGIIPNQKGKEIKERIEKLNLVFKTGEIFPTDNVLCVIPKENKTDLFVMKWGIKTKSLLINAKVETLDDRLTFKAIKNNRCAVVSNGFYEWDKDSNKYYINTDEDYIYLACIFNEKNELVILTKAANHDFKHIHERMPIIMNKQEMIKYIHNEECLFSKKELNIKEVIQDISLF